MGENKWILIREYTRNRVRDLATSEQEKADFLQEGFFELKRFACGGERSEERQPTSFSKSDAEILLKRRSLLRLMSKGK